MSVTPKKEWLCESGYCNCLLVTMSRGSLPRVELFSDQQPPHLDMLIFRPDTQAWLRAQQFDYATLDTSRIIDSLAQLARITKSFWRYKPDSTGSIRVHDCVEDNGPVVELHFTLRLLSSGGVLHLTVLQDIPEPPPL